MTDTLGSVVSSFNNLPNGAAVVLGDQVYGPYGNRRVQQGTISTSKGFTGQFTDFVAGLDYYGARYYDPVVGVFVSADTVQGNMQGMNPYAYVGGNPETNTDPTGQFAYDPETGQAGRIVNGKVQIWQYSVGIQPSPSLLVLPPSVVAAVQSVGSLWGHYQLPDLGQKVGPSSSGSPAQSKPDVMRVPISTTCGAGLGAFCPGMGANGAVHFGPYTASIPVGFNPGDVYPGGGGDESGTGGGGSGKPTSEDASSCGNLSFTAATRVATTSGEQAIGTLKVGEQVWSYNPTTTKMELQPILHVWINHDNDLVDLTITKTTHGKATKPSSEVIHTNKKHPFLTVEKGFLSVGQIKLGMHVVEADGQVGVVSEWKVVPGVQVMYNLEVAQDHTFTVGFGQWVVHNCNPYDVVTYRPSTAPLENHHGILDKWATENISGYESRAGDNPTIALTSVDHAATKAVYRTWLFEKTGRAVGGVVDWQQVSAREIYDLSERMFDAANVPQEARGAYYRAFYRYIYRGR